MEKTHPQKSNKKLVIFLIVLFGLIFSLYFLLSTNTQFLRLTGRFSSVEPEKDIYTAINSLIDGKNSVSIELEKNDTCYWIIPGRDENSYFIEVREYGKEFSECIGSPKNTNYIKTDQNVKMYSNGCLCQGNYVLELINDGLKISKV
jgi:hypothetical protein